MSQRATESEFTLDTAAELAAEEPASVIRGRSPWYLAWRRLRRNYVAFAFLGLFVVILVACAMAGVYARHVAHSGPLDSNPLGTVTVSGRSIPVVSPGGYLDKKTGKPCTTGGTECELIPSIPIGPQWFAAGGRYVLGADLLGRDVAVRLLYGGRNSLIVGIGSSAICVFCAVVLALLAGYFGGWIDFVITRFFDLFYAFPVVLLGIALGSALAINGFHHFGINIESGSLWIPTLVISYVLIPYVGRPLRGQVLSLREKEFVEAAIAQGASPLRIMFSDLLPNIISSTLVFFTLIIANNIVLEAALSFLGAGVQPPTPSWGTLISEGQQLIVTRPWLALAPGIAIVLTVLAFFVRRTIGAALVCAAVTFVVFVIFIVVPGGDPAQRIAGKNATQQNIVNIRHSWGFDQPFYTQYWKMMRKMFTGELVSYTSQQNVLQQIQQGMPATFSLTIGAGVIWLFFGIIVGVISAVTAGKLSDRVITVLALIGISMPVFWLGIVARYYLAEGGVATIFPDGEYVPLTSNPIQWFWHLLLPWIVLAILFIGFYGRVLRGNILDTISEDFVRTAKAKGLSSRRILVKHVLRTSLIPVVTLFGLDFAAVLGGGAILTETVFDLHGVGQYARQSINNFDLPPIMGVTMYGAFFIVLFSVLVDLFYAYLDPRIRPT